MTAIEEEVLDHKIALIGHVHLAAHALGEVLSKPLILPTSNALIFLGLLV